jgi:hypothetical protein
VAVRFCGREIRAEREVQAEHACSPYYLKINVTRM